MKLFYLLLITFVPGGDASSSYSPEPMTLEVCIAKGKEWAKKRATYDFQCVGPVTRN